MASAPAPRERTSPRLLSTADERREDVLRAAMKVVGTRGLYGTPTLEIANAAGISQAYLFRLFPTKLGLFLAVVERSFQQVQD
ncbi:MAG: TetR/AcrR family transcriptional regulator, partial [Trebonia sp.]